MKKLLIALFILFSLLICSITYAQTTTGTGSMPLFSGGFAMAGAGYKPQQKFDTVKVRILYDLGGNVPACKTGWIVRQWYSYYDPWLGDCMGGTPNPPDKWFDTETLLSEDKKSTIDKRVVWQYHNF